MTSRVALFGLAGLLALVGCAGPPRPVEARVADLRAGILAPRSASLLPRDLRAVVWVPRLGEALRRGGVLAGAPEREGAWAALEVLAARAFGLEALDEGSLGEQGIALDGEAALAWLRDDTYAVAFELARPEAFERAARRSLTTGAGDVAVASGFGTRAYVELDAAFVLRGRHAVVFRGTEAALHAQALTRPSQGERLADDEAFATALRAASSAPDGRRPSPAAAVYIAAAGAQRWLGLAETHWVRERGPYVEALERRHSEVLVAAADRLASREALRALDAAHRRRVARVEPLAEALPRDRLVAPLGGLFVTLEPARAVAPRSSWALRGVVLGRDVTIPEGSLPELLALLGAEPAPTGPDATVSIDLGRLVMATPELAVARVPTGRPEVATRSSQPSSTPLTGAAPPRSDDAALLDELVDVQRGLARLDEESARRAWVVAPGAGCATLRLRVASLGTQLGRLEGELALEGGGVFPALVRALAPSEDDVVTVAASRTRAALLARRSTLLDALYRTAGSPDGAR
ncbi:MAG: hypothetical protein FJ095_14490 [Deltaproteobacteria bacterium]|nr:hypothetical protein [Deltaproteobacteria bacterium]